jgi:hypothetical protein
MTTTHQLPTAAEANGRAYATQIYSAALSAGDNMVLGEVDSRRLALLVQDFAQQLFIELTEKADAERAERDMMQARESERVKKWLFPDDVYDDKLPPCQGEPIA